VGGEGQKALISPVNWPYPPPYDFQVNWHCTPRPSPIKHSSVRSCPAAWPISVGGTASLDGKALYSDALERGMQVGDNTRAEAALQMRLKEGRCHILIRDEGF
jgi:hypothetical protein